MRLFKVHGSSALLLDQADRLRCVTPVESGMDRLDLVLPCSICSLLRTFVSVLCPCSRTWPPYLRISGRYACVLDTCANVSLRLWHGIRAKAVGRIRPSLAVVCREPASQRLLLLVSLQGCRLTTGRPSVDATPHAVFDVFRRCYIYIPGTYIYTYRYIYSYAQQLASMEISLFPVRES
ncbi:hypothetical protein V8C35DRAFT_22553 [Trichoderma chlorosporum]